MNWKRKLGAVLVALAFMALPAAAASATLTSHSPHGWIPLVLSLGVLAAGTVTVTWASPVPLNPNATYTGGTTPPTAAQAGQSYNQVVTVNLTDSDTTFSITHNLGLTAAQAAAFLPQLIGPYLTAGGPSTTFMPPITWNFSNTNVLVGTKLTTAGSGCTFNVILRYPAV